jgi:hypothetical protein
MNALMIKMKIAFFASCFVLYGVNASAQINTQFVKEFNALANAKPLDIITNDTVTNINGIVSYKSKLPLKGCRIYCLKGAFSLSAHAYYLQKATEVTVDSILTAIFKMPYTVIDSKTNADASKKMGAHTLREVALAIDEEPTNKTTITLSKSGDLSFHFTKRDSW